MLNLIKSFLFEYFWLPIVDESVYYNVYNTTAYGLIFAVLVVYVVFPLVKKFGINFDEDFLLAMTPYIFLSGFLRSLKDLNIVETILLETPIIYIILFTLTIFILYFSKKLSLSITKHSYTTITFITGLLLLLTTLAVIILNTSTDLGALGKFLFIFILSSSAFFLVSYVFNEDLISIGFVLPVFAHYADASSTIVSLANGGEEKHVLASIFIDNLGPYSMYLMKSMFIIPAAYYIVKEFDEEKRNYYVFLITLLGFALATRNISSTIFLI